MGSHSIALNNKVRYAAIIPNFANIIRIFSIGDGLPSILFRQKNTVKKFTIGINMSIFCVFIDISKILPVSKITFINAATFHMQKRSNVKARQSLNIFAAQEQRCLKLEYLL